MSMNKKDNRKSLMKHRAQIQQLKDQIKAKEDELAKLMETTRAEEETEIVLLLQTHKIGLEDMEKMLNDVRQSADITAMQEKPANKTTTKKNEEVSHNEKTDDKP